MSDGQITITNKHLSENEYKAKLGRSLSLKILYVNKRIIKKLKDKDILARKIYELLLYLEYHEPIFTNLQQKNITIFTNRRMIHNVCLEYSAIKAKEINDVFQIKASQDTKLSNHNADIIEIPIIKEQEVLEPISYLENSTLHNNL
ncbi:hypothetical protein C1645_817337 [Glomus cerebriforme]|uniref:Uncharacterized protein n=1 Tax=Glomus cerebriforme TaxID=658196 RepID=A0A397T9N1_9GLOM|nr:hypothetical protein C1645_817337 [Glomus cerebriforme]